MLPFLIDKHCALGDSILKPSMRSAPSCASATTFLVPKPRSRALAGTTLHVTEHSETHHDGLPHPSLGEGRGKTAGAQPKASTCELRANSPLENEER